MQKYDFWDRWLLSVSLLIVVFGLMLAFFNQSNVFDLLFNRWVDPVFWKTDPLPPNAQGFQAWAYGVLGATTAGWGVFLAFVAAYPYRRRERWAWNCMAAGIAIWFLVDTSFSIYYRVFYNAVFNLLLLIIFLLPLATTHQEFTDEGPGNRT